MGIVRLNHAVLYVSDLAASVRFYTDVLGFRRVDMTPDGFRRVAFLQAAGSTNDHDMGLFEVGPVTVSPARGGSVGLYHLAWEADTLAELAATADALRAAGALSGASDHGTTKSLYGRDPDGLEFEIVWLVPADRLDEASLDARRRIGPLDLDRETTRYGGNTRGGVGISSAAPSGGSG